MVVDIVAKLNILVVSIEASIQVVSADISVGGGLASITADNGGLPIGFVGVRVDIQANAMLLEMKSLSLTQKVNFQKCIPDPFPSRRLWK